MLFNATSTWNTYLSGFGSVEGGKGGFVNFQAQIYLYQFAKRALEGSLLVCYSDKLAKGCPHEAAQLLSLFVLLDHNLFSSPEMIDDIICQYTLCVLFWVSNMKA